MPATRSTPCNARDRVLLAFHHEEADRVPIFAECRNVPFIEQVTGRRLAGRPEELERVTAEAYRQIGIVALRTLMTPRWGIVKGEDYDVRWDGYLNWKVGGERTFTYEEATALFQRKWLGNSRPAPADEAAAYLREVRRLQAILGDAILFIPMLSACSLESMYHSVGIENFCLMIYEAPEAVDEALERNTRRAEQIIDVVNAEYDGPVIHSGDDLAMKGKTIFSPAWLRAHIFPRLARVAARIHAGGKFFSFHSCGNVAQVLPDLLALGVDALDPLEHTAGMDLAELKRLYGDRMVLIGNADANVVQMGTPEAVRAEVRRCLDEGAPGGGYFLSGGVTQATPVENLLAYFHEARTYQGYRHAGARGGRS